MLDDELHDVCFRLGGRMVEHGLSSGITEMETRHVGLIQTLKLS